MYEQVSITDLTHLYEHCPGYKPWLWSLRGNRCPACEAFLMGFKLSDRDNGIRPERMRPLTWVRPTTSWLHMDGSLTREGSWWTKAKLLLTWPQRVTSEGGHTVYTVSRTSEGGHAVYTGGLVYIPTHILTRSNLSVVLRNHKLYRTNIDCLQIDVISLALGTLSPTINDSWVPPCWI